MTISLSFHGAAGTVTGSRHLVATSRSRVLFDCGLFQGLKALRQRNWAAPAFDARSLDAVVLTHAHIDHTGYLPRLVKLGFDGPVYCTPATAELLEILLMDSAHLQEEDADYANRKGFSKHQPALPLYNTGDVERALRLVKPVEFDRWRDVGRGIRVRFQPVGHILGSAHVEADIRDGDEHTSVCFSGDVGRYGAALHADPDPAASAEAMVLESTYGDRTHDHRPLAEQLAGPFRKALNRGGTILIPAFAVGRAQLVTLIVRDLMATGVIPTVPVHIDSPMAADVTDLYARYLGSEELDPGIGDPVRDKLFPRGVSIHRSVEESKKLNAQPGPRIIISANGMLTGGRVLHHLHRVLLEPKSLVVLVGYQAEGTRGRAMVDGAETVRLHGEDVPIRCDFLAVDGLSAHADADELVRWAKSAPQRPRTVFLVHGEAGSSDTLAQRLRGDGFHTIVPRLEQRFALDSRSNRWREA